MAKRKSTTAKGARPSRGAVQWGGPPGNPMIMRDGAWPRRIQAQRWRSIQDAMSDLSEVASAIKLWRQSNDITHGMTPLSAMGARAVDVTIALSNHLDALWAVSPTLRAEVDKVEAFEKKGGAQ